MPDEPTAPPVPESQSGIPQADASNQDKESSKAKELRTKNSKARRDYRDEIDEAPPINNRLLGTNTVLVEEAIASGPLGIRQAQRTALKFARKFQQEQEDRWKIVTKWLAAKQSNSSDRRGRACATFALAWRPKFLAALSLTRAPTLAARFAHITRDMAYEHRKLDEEFAQQWADAQAEAVELLHSRCFQRALEGDCEPVWYMGIRVGYVRKYDSKLQIEMLRAYKPDTFKTAGVNVNVGIRNDTLVLTEDMRHKLMEYNRQWLEDPSTLQTEAIEEKSQLGTVDSQALSP